MPGDRHPDIGVAIDGHVAVVELRRPPHNYFDAGLIAALADIYEALDRDDRCRAILLAAQGKSFCAGADHGKAPAETGTVPPLSVAREAVRLFRTHKPVVAAVHGSAVGGGLGLALSADFRVTCPSARFWPNFARLGFHAGFGLSVTLPRLVGQQQAAMLLMTGRRVDGAEAVALGMADVLSEDDDVRAKGFALATEIAASAPLAVGSMRATLRRGLADAVERASEREALEQAWQRRTADFAEGVAAVRERRAANFKGC